MTDRFGDWTLPDIKTADIEDFIADPKLPPGRESPTEPDARPWLDQSHDPILRHMLNWAVGRECLDRRRSDAARKP